MNIRLTYLGFDLTDGLAEKVRRRLLPLEEFVSVRAVRMVLEWSPTRRPHCRIRARLAADRPRGTFHASANDDTVAEALEKVVGKLERQIRSCQPAGTPDPVGVPPRPKPLAPRGTSSTVRAA